MCTMDGDCSLASASLYLPSPSSSSSTSASFTEAFPLLVYAPNTSLLPTPTDPDQGKSLSHLIDGVHPLAFRRFYSAIIAILLRMTFFRFRIFFWMKVFFHFRILLRFRHACSTGSLRPRLRSSMVMPRSTSAHTGPDQPFLAWDVSRVPCQKDQKFQTAFLDPMDPGPKMSKNPSLNVKNLAKLESKLGQN